MHDLLTEPPQPPVPTPKRLQGASAPACGGSASPPPAKAPRAPPGAATEIFVFDQAKEMPVLHALKALMTTAPTNGEDALARAIALLYVCIVEQKTEQNNGRDAKV